MNWKEGNIEQHDEGGTGNVFPSDPLINNKGILFDSDYSSSFTPNTNKFHIRYDNKVDQYSFKLGFYMGATTQKVALSGIWRGNSLLKCFLKFVSTSIM